MTNYDGQISPQASTGDAPRGEEARAETPGIGTEGWMKVAAITVLFIAVFWPNLRRLWDKTNPFTGEPNWGHAICIPFIGLYYLYINREELLAAKVTPLLPGRFKREHLVVCAILFVSGMVMFLGPTVMGRSNLGTDIATSFGLMLVIAAVLACLLDWGLASILLGLGLYAYGIWPGQNDFVKDFGMVVTLFGVVALLAGWSVMKIAWFPIAFLVCAIPWPGLVYSWIAGPLQVLAAKVAVGALEFTGVNAFASGTYIYIAGFGNELRTLNVAEACAGLKSLMTFISIGGAIAFLSSRPFWQKALITVCSVPIAIFCNVARVAGQGLLDHYISQELSESFAHQFVGMIMLIPAFFLILFVGYVLDHLFVVEVRRRELSRELDEAGEDRSMVGAIPRWKRARLSSKGVNRGGANVKLRPLGKVPVLPVLRPRSESVGLLGVPEDLAGAGEAGDSEERKS